MFVRLEKLMVLFFVLMMITSGMGSAATITVDGGGGQDHTTIQAAIDAANDSDTIIVYSGTYSEILTINKRIVISSIYHSPTPTRYLINAFFT